LPFLVGTSGFDYKHWRGPFYPPELRPGDRLTFYAERFPTVELNVTFYRMPKVEAFRKWAAEVPDGFIFAVKASRYLTHVKRLLDPEDPVKYLLESARNLGPHLGPFLLQLPPDMEAQPERLARTLEAFGKDRVAVEFRHASWFTDEVMDVLRSHGAALCLVDRAGPKDPICLTAAWTYVRFHQGRSFPGPCYREQSLLDWRDRLAELAKASGQSSESTTSFGLDGYAFFNNDFRACAVEDAETFGRILGPGVLARDPAIRQSE
jgi:uncharacterized protein YecE (DUF72 family)